jgi:YegS/Rv2252/BmrU family lipid kinase
MKETAMRIKAIINPRSNNGNHKYLKAMLKEKFSGYLVGIDETTYPKHAIEIAKKAVKEDIDTIVVVGGDGTINEALNGIAGSDVALGIIPTGTANDLASLYNIPKDIDQACDVIFEQHIHRADLICVNGHYYATAGGFGFPCEVVSVANAIKNHGKIGKLLGRVLGSKLYILAVLCSLVKKSKTKTLLNIQSNGSSLTVDSLSLTVNNQPFLGKNLLMSPGAVNNDGRFDICLIGNSKSRFQVLSILLKVLAGKHIYSSSVSTWLANKLVVSSEKPLAFFGDGEIIQQGTRFNIRIIPEALKIIVPAQKERS